MNEASIGNQPKDKEGDPELLFSQAKKELVNYLKSLNIDLVLCLGDSVSEIAEYLKAENIPTIHLNHAEGTQLYEKGTLEDQTKRIKQLIKQNKKVVMVEDSVLSGGKIWQLRMVFDYADIPFKAVVLAANPDQKEDYLDIISTEPSLVSFLQNKIGSSMDSRKNQ